MSTQYVLKCPAGHAITVGVSQAGLSTTCPECGAETAVPTMRDLNRLPRAADPADSTNEPKPWGVAQGLTTAGLILFIIAVGAGFVFWSALPSQDLLPVIYDEEAAHAYVDSLTLAESFELWNKEMSKPLSSEETPLINQYRQMRSQALWFMGASALLAVLGVCLFIAGRVRASNDRQPPRPRRDH